MFEKVEKCPLCGSNDLIELFTIQDRLSEELMKKIYLENKRAFLKEITNHLVICNGCQLIFLSPRLNKDCLSRLYKLWYSYGYQQIFNDEKLIKNRKEEFRRYHYRLISKYFKEPGCLLDVGCGTGLFLDLCRNDGWDIQGVEFNKDTYIYAKEVFGLDIFNGDFLSFDPRSKRYDVITMFDFLEHVENPIENLMHAHRLLVPGGFIFIRVPNVNSLQSNIMKKKWYGIISNHLFYFNAKTIKAVLEKSDFELLEIKAVNYTRFHSIILSHFGYISGRLKNILSAKNKPTAFQISAVNPVLRNSTTSSFLSKPRVGEYFFGILMEIIDFIGGVVNRGNNLTVIAKKV
jgi:2-polyprenyl-3-methyl-5-hydroxy-6-metoxy-1,4-benzoquinol methylase